MDEKPNRFININQEPLDDNGFSSSKSIDNVDNSVNDSLENYQNNQSNLNIPNRKNNGNSVIGKGINAATGGKFNKIKNTPVVGNAVKGLENKLTNNKGRNNANTDNYINNNVNNMQNQENVPEGLKKNRDSSFKNLVGNPNSINTDTNNRQSELGKKDSLNPLSKKKEESEDSLKSTLKPLKGIRKVWLVIVGALSSLPFLLPAIVLVIVIGTIFGPISEAVGFVVGKVQEFGQSLINMFTFKGFKSNETLVKEFEAKVDKVMTLYPEMDKESLKSALYYGFYSFEEYLQELEDEDDPDDADSFEDTFNFKTLRVYTFTVANQLIYSTVIFDNNLIQSKEEEEEEADYTLVPNTLDENVTNLPTDLDKVKTDKSGNKYKKICTSEKDADGNYTCGDYTCKNDDCSGDESKTEKKKKEKFVYSCPSGSIMIDEARKDLCDGENRGTIKVGDKETKSADFCLNLVNEENVKKYKKEDPNFNENLKCVSYTFETGTELSKAKFENFLKFVLVPERYFDKDLGTSERYVWKEYVTKFNDIDFEDKDNYNIPYHAIGVGKLDLFSSLDDKEKREAERTTSTLLSFIKATKHKIIGEKYHIPGAASLPLDFVIKATPEETIKSRITSGFGPRTAKVAGESTYHYALDFSGSTGTPIYSTFDGVVVQTKDNDSCGISAKIGHDLNGDGTYDYYTKYCHMSSRFVRVGETVMNGQKIGLVGSTGVATGPHLHFEIRNEKDERINPLNYVIDIAKGTSQLSTVVNSLTPEKINQLTSVYQNLMAGYSHTREGVARTAKFLVDNLAGLPNYCGGYTTQLLDLEWYTNKVVQNNKCSNNGYLSKYGLDNIGFINWAFTQAGFGTKLYTIPEVKELGNRLNIYDAYVKVGDIAYNGDNIGIIIEIDEDKAVVAHVNSSGLTTTIVNRKLATSPFKYAVSLDNFYGNSI